MSKQISEYSNKIELRNLMENAKRLGRQDVWQEAFRRLCMLDGLDQFDPLHRGFYEMLAAYEELLTAKNGRTTRANRTRQKLKSKGVVQCLEDWALSANLTDGFQLLVENNLVELTGEYLVTKYPSKFSMKTVQAAKTRLERIGFRIPSE